ncbi:hypothetical protein YenMTG1_104 [Yersinia phage vB_YenM_TG1]|uniref:Uncharacterized protein n=1 Tax=Yersinia phage vB_YenM_TG1 TaxID=1589265 RepID=A0A0B5A2H6_9CAUD|nr:hypothetical protein AVV33_gp104 [Yersinia phage vB_YenM_TG1]AJD81914.1 hypothetical protein YenMTG1_104 [Yersinia phage vB_YenM_TG1]
MSYIIYVYQVILNKLGLGHDGELFMATIQAEVNNPTLFSFFSAIGPIEFAFTAIGVIIFAYVASTMNTLGESLELKS